MSFRFTFFRTSLAFQSLVFLLGKRNKTRWCANYKCNQSPCIKFCSQCLAFYRMEGRHSETNLKSKWICKDRNFKIFQVQEKKILVLTAVHKTQDRNWHDCFEKHIQPCCKGVFTFGYVLPNSAVLIQGDQKSLCTWWLQYRNLQVMFKVSPASITQYNNIMPGHWTHINAICYP
jgi:hypothetical protein